MSNLNHTPLVALSDAEDLIEITSYDEMASRPAFEIDINPKVLKLVKIIGHYRFRDFVRCGLKTCHHAHGPGYLVVTDDGRETNIGHKCGKTHFGHEFGALRNRYESRRRVRDYRERLGEFKTSLPAIWTQITELHQREYGADWLYSTQRAFRTGCPKALLDSLYTRARTDDTRVFKSTTLEGEEAQKRLAAENKLRLERSAPQDDERPRTYTVEEAVGDIKGLAIWRFSIRDLLVEGLESELLAFEQLSIFTLSEAKLQRQVKITESVPRRIAECEALVAEGMKFFTDENIAIVREIPLSTDAARDLRRKRWDNKKAVWRMSN